MQAHTFIRSSIPPFEFFYCCSPFRDDQLGQIMETLGTTFGTGPDVLGNLADNVKNSTTASADLADVQRRLPSAEALEAEFGLASSPGDYYPDQKAGFDLITSLGCGLALLTGGPGSGKVRATTRGPKDHCCTTA